LQTTTKQQSPASNICKAKDVFIHKLINEAIIYTPHKHLDHKYKIGSKKETTTLLLVTLTNAISRFFQLHVQQ